MRGLRKWMRLGHVLDFKYLGCVLGESGTDEAECSTKVASGRKVSGAIRFLVKALSLQLECPKVLYESLLVTVLAYGSVTMIWREKERSRIQAEQMDNLRGFLGIRRMDSRMHG